MFKRLLALGILLTSAAYGETIWWHTNGAAVVQLTNTCALFLFEQDTAAVITWNKTDTESIEFEDIHRQFDDTPIEVRIGDAYLGDRLFGFGTNTVLSIPFQEPVHELLRNAAQISAKTPDYEMTINLTPTKMPVLLTAVDKCRTKLR